MNHNYYSERQMLEKMFNGHLDSLVELPHNVPYSILLKAGKPLLYNLELSTFIKEQENQTLETENFED